MKDHTRSQTALAAHPTIRKYLTRQAPMYERWPLTGRFDPGAVRAVVVIPALAERGLLFETLASLGASSTKAQSGTLVICVINNHAAGLSPAEDIEDNQETLREFSGYMGEGRYSPMMLAVVDASSDDRALPAGEGVGLARKIGLDHGLRVLASTGRLQAPLVCLDADSPPASGYLDAVLAFYEDEARWAGYAAYMHRFPEAIQEREAIIAYEIYMRYHEIGLRHAGSPYAYPALGSIISCTAKAYAACGGMNRRCAGEDFYFMQQLAKTGTMDAVPCALVYPSGRVSCRTPFGTGRSVRAFECPTALDVPLYHPGCYELLGKFFSLVRENGEVNGIRLLEFSGNLHPELGEYLHGRGFVQAWEGLRQRYRDPSQRLHQFHVWFDGLRTIQFIHRLRESALPDLTTREALHALTDWLPEEMLWFADMPGEAVLDALRRTGLRRHGPRVCPVPDYCPDVFLRLPVTS
ncbi:MAG TPA: hypothetical protein PLL36_09110 [Candidatus Hydrogenedentes bacterium]|jgi:hypothetical protein|nr:hypothetical protein [Candidatus Hydrogenedentota bacterium]HQN01222.1 hypothetical protein [Candidatus Hydrogenedentota bacterium]